MPRDEASQLPDEDLLARYASGDRNSAAVLASRHLPRVFRHAKHVLGDGAAAEDVAQDAMMRLWKVAPRWRSGEAQVSTWLYRVTANLCTDILRKRRTIPLEDIASAPDPSPAVDVTMQESLRRDALQEALNSLPERQREAVVLRHIEGLANPEIAGIMGLSTRAVESLTARGKRGLHAALTGRREELGFENDT